MDLPPLPDASNLAKMMADSATNYMHETLKEGQKFDAEKSANEYRFYKQWLEDQPKRARQERFRFWLPVGISLLALALAAYSVWLQLQTQLTP